MGSDEETLKAVEGLTTFFNIDPSKLAGLDSETMKRLLVVFSSLVIANRIIHDHVPNSDEAISKAKATLADMGITFSDVDNESLERLYDGTPSEVSDISKVEMYKREFNR